MRQRLRRGFSLVEMLVVLVVIAILAMFLFPKLVGGSKSAYDKKVRSPMQQAHSVECQNALSQIRTAHQAAMASAIDDESKPRALTDLKAYGLPESMMACPVGKEPYQYDPAAGRARCVHPGHESL